MLIRYSADQKGKPVQKAVVYTKEEHNIPVAKIDTDAVKIISHLREYGYSAFIVGGAVRDLLCNKTPKDIDIVTDATPSKIKKIFRNSRIIGRRFRLVHVFFGETIYEVSTFRSLVDGTVGNSFGTMDEDVLRRDFTLNALYYDPIKEQIVDYVGGINDIKQKKLKPVIPIDRIFIEDPVRMLRAVKYAATTGCRMTFSLKHKIRTSAHLLSPISPSRLTEELLKIINSGHAYDIVTCALRYDLFMYLQPAATALMYADRKFEQNYLSHIKEMDDFHLKNPDARLGDRLFYLVYDFISGLTDWNKEITSKTAIGELYTKTWQQCRQFILPMNPQRIELEYAIRESLKKMGISVRIPKGTFSRNGHTKFEFDDTLSEIENNETNDSKEIKNSDSNYGKKNTQQTKKQKQRKRYKKNIKYVQDKKAEINSSTKNALHTELQQAHIKISAIAGSP